MKPKKLMDALNGVDEKYISEAQPGKRARGRVLRLTALAAAILILSVSIPLAVLFANKPNDGKFPETGDTGALLSQGTTTVLTETEAPAVTTTDTPVPSTETPIPSTDTPIPSTETPAVLPDRRLVENGFVFELNADLCTYSIVDTLGAGFVTTVPDTINGYPVTEFKDLPMLMEEVPGVYRIYKNAIFINGSAYFLPMTDGVIDIEGTGFYIEGNCLIDPASGVLLTAYDHPVIPDDGSVREIAPYAFMNSEGVGLLHIPDSVEKIDRYAFCDCRSLTGVCFDGTVSSIGKNAFIGCDGVETVTIGDLSAWECVTFENRQSNPLFCGARLIVSGKVYEDYAAEPDSAADEQAWLRWLTEDIYCAGAVKYPALSFGGGYYGQYFVRSGETFEMISQDSTAWEIWNNRFLLFYMLRSSVYDNCKWKIYYRKSGTNDDYQSIITTPESTYRFELNLGGEQVIYRLPVYDDGMTDIGSNDGAPQDYDFIFIIRNKKTGNIVGWYQDILPVTDSYDLWLADAVEKGLVG